MPPTLKIREALKPSLIPFLLLHVVKINEKRKQHSWLGEPQTSPALTPNGRGWYQHFQHGSIYYSKETGAFEVHGLIREKYAALGWENSFLGFPATDETTTPDGLGRFNHFQGGSIYWTPETGAWEVHGAIRDRWAELGWERSFLGYPVSDEFSLPDGIGRASNFQGGQIAWSPSLGAAVSATIPLPHNGGGGTRPQDHGHGNGSPPEIRRRVVIAAHMHLTDHETFGSNEHSDADLQREAIITNRTPQQLMQMSDGAGGELKVELKLDAQATDEGDVILTGQVLMFEGTSENSNDLDGDEPVNFLVPRDNFTSKTYTVTNEDEGGDVGVVTLTASNFAV